MKPILCIDPGASGGMAIFGLDGCVEAVPMPEGMTAQIDAIRNLAVANPSITAILEFQSTRPARGATCGSTYT